MKKNEICKRMSNKQKPNDGQQKNNNGNNNCKITY